VKSFSAIESKNILHYIVNVSWFSCSDSTLENFLTFNLPSAPLGLFLIDCFKSDSRQLDPVSWSLLVKFIKRILNRRYKGKNHTYIRYVLEIPAKFNRKIADYSEMTFEIHLTSSETLTQEVLTIALVGIKRHKGSTPAT
jgi:hypothetical protein